MQKIIFKNIYVLVFFASLTANAQWIRGVVFDQKTQTTLPGATIYQDGTTNVTVSDENGAFSLNTKGLNISVMVRFMGYDTKRIDEPLQYQDKKVQIFLEEQSFFLDEVVVGRQSPFTRRQMLDAFREQFLGTSKSASRCKIKNEEDIILKYDITKKTLTANARQPLQIINNYLEYEINFDLVELVVIYKSIESLEAYFVTNSYFSGYSFYTNLAKNEKANKKRLETFYGSTTHFMRALAYENLEEEKWEIYVNSFKVNPETYFEITDSLHYKKIKLIKKPEKVINLDRNEIFISKPNNIPASSKVESDGVIRKPVYIVPLYRRKEQSLLEFLQPEIYVDSNGNHLPIYGIVFGGSLGALKAGDLLPIDYFQTIKELQNKPKVK